MILLKFTSKSKKALRKEFKFSKEPFLRQNGGLRETSTVRRVASGVGVEKTFPVNAPVIEKIEIVRLGKVRRAKLFYLRDRVGKAAKVKEKIRR